MREYMSDLADGGVALLGCGRMGSGMLDGWLEAGLPARAVTVIDPAPGPRLAELENEGLVLNPGHLEPAAVCVLSVKPQMMEAALPKVAGMAGAGTLFLSIAAGLPLGWFAARLDPRARVVRAMPNTPAAVGKGVSALIAADTVDDHGLGLAEALLSAIGTTVRLEEEGQMDAVTAVSGSGPAYVFHLIEALAAAGEAEGLPAPLAMQLARATVLGAGALAEAAAEDAAQLRVNVTSPGGTTQAGLEALMDPASGLTPLMTRTVAAAAARSRELAG